MVRPWLLPVAIEVVSWLSGFSMLWCFGILLFFGIIIRS